MDDPYIRVTGTGLLRLKPDLCRITLNLRGLEKAYADCLSRASRDSAALGEAIAALGFRREDLKTTDFSVDTEYESIQEEGRWRQEFNGYRYAQALKEAGVRILTAPNGGFGDPALIDRFIAENQTDMVAMGRAFIAEPEYVPKLLSGRPLTPCIRCGRCHGSIDDCVAVCSVNPAVGLENRLQYMVL